MAYRLLCPSMMCSDYDNLKEETIRLDQAGADIFHLDVMDGDFVPNFAMGLTGVQCIRKHTKKRLDVHLMVKHPEHAVRIFAGAGVDIIYVHAEAETDMTQVLADIRSSGICPGIAVNPETRLEAVVGFLPVVDYVLMMTVTPGFAGQRYQESVTDKIRDLAAMREEVQKGVQVCGNPEAGHFQIIADGAMSQERIEQLSHIGADGFVLGTSVLFGKGEAYQAIMDRLHG